MVTKLMGTLLFLIGFVLIGLAVLALLGYVEPRGFGERLLMFTGGLILCVLGFLMARDQSTTV